MSSIFHKKRMKRFDFTAMIHKVDLFSFVFWEKLKTQKTFRNKLTLTTMKKIFLREAGRQQEARSHFVGVLKTDFLSEAFVSKRKIIALSSTFLWILFSHTAM
jgi:hypothetical protein